MPSRCSSPRCRISSSVRPTSSGCSWVCTNQPGRTRAPSLALPVCRPARSARRRPAGAPRRGRCRPGQQPQEVRLAGAVGAEDRDPLAVPDLEVERLHQSGELELLADHRPLAGAAALEAHLDLLLTGLLGRRAGLLELAQSRLRRLVAAGHAVVVRRLLPVHEHERLELRVLLVPAAAQLLEAGRTGRWRASWYVAKPPGWVHTRLPAAPSSTVTTRVAVLSSSSRSWLMNRIVFATPGCAPRARACPARRGSCRARRAAAPRRARRAGTPAPAASAHRRTASSARGTSPARTARREPDRARRPR